MVAARLAWVLAWLFFLALCIGTFLVAGMIVLEAFERAYKEILSLFHLYQTEISYPLVAAAIAVLITLLSRKLRTLIVESSPYQLCAETLYGWRDKYCPLVEIVLEDTE